MNMQSIWPLLKETYNEWNEDKAPRLAAALAYYTLFSLAPLLVIAIAVAGLVFGQDAVEGQLFGQIRGFVGDTGAAAIQDMIRGASNFSSGIIATIIGIVTLLFGAAGLFGQLQDALNTIWEVQLKPGLGFMEILKQRFFSFSMVLGTGFLLLVSLIISTVLTSAVGYLQSLLPGSEILWQIVNFLVSFAITTGLFALIFKVIPDAEIGWGDVFWGAVVTSLLFSIGRFALAYYLGRGSFSSSYGAAGSLVVVLLWIYYSAQIMFFGAEFTQVYARSHGSRIQPAKNAIALAESARQEQGMARTDHQPGAADRQLHPDPARISNETKQASKLTTVLGFLTGILIGRRQHSDKTDT